MKKSINPSDFDSQHISKQNNLHKHTQECHCSSRNKMACTKRKYSPDNPAPHYLQASYSIYFLPVADFLNNPRERMANLVQSITCFDRAICLCHHINCLGSVWRNTVSCSALLCCFIRHMVSGWCATRTLLPAQNASQNWTIWPSSSVCVCVHICRCSLFSSTTYAYRNQTAGTQWHIFHIFWIFLW